jgi:diguanylate cyclase
MKELRHEIESIRQEAYTDALTAIPNRKRFDFEIVRLVAEALENKEPISLGFIDIDHFKSFNDAFGHQVGDQVLRLVAKTFTEGLKGQDFVCRYGGEEFMIVMPKTASDGASKIINILRETVKNKEIRHRKTGEALTKISFSAGVATLAKKEEIQQWIDRADQALYEAKRKGRDCVVSSEKT